mgnify:CR=1 FL=1
MRECYAVVIPAWNAEATITEAIDSLLGQCVPPLEVIVVDDGSTDVTAARVSAYGARVKLLRQPNRGPGAATSAGLAEVSTPFVAFLDADDVWLPGKARRQLQYLTEKKGSAGVFARAKTFRGPLAEPVFGAESDLWSRSTMMVRTADAHRIGDMIDPVGGRGDVIDWLARGRELGMRFDMLEEVLVLRRIRPGSLSYGRDAAKDRGYLEVVRRALERRRARDAEDGGADA